MKLELKLTNDWLEATWYTETITVNDVEKQVGVDEDEQSIMETVQEETITRIQVHCENFSGHPEHIAMLRARVVEFATPLSAEQEAMVADAIANFVMPTQAELDAYAEAQALAQAKADKALALSTLTVTTQSGKTFDGDETARVDMLTAISMANVVGQTSTMWKMADNTIVEVTLVELQEALLLALTKKGEIIGAVNV